MIGYLKGKVISTQNSQIILNVNNVGYLIHTSQTHLKKINQTAKFFVYTHVTENNISLFGFNSLIELNFFKTLIKVSGIGPKLALTILSHAKTDDIINAVKAGNVSFFTTIPGIGKKSAQKLIVELKSRLDNSQIDLNILKQNNELVQALESLGFKKAEFAKILNQVNPQAPLDNQIKESLKLIHS
jgi:Holliday junction DNA helicase RuvA